MLFQFHHRHCCSVTLRCRILLGTEYVGARNSHHTHTWANSIWFQSNAPTDDIIGQSSLHQGLEKQNLVTEADRERGNRSPTSQSGFWLGCPNHFHKHLACFVRVLDFS
jgi:hypothetical protein